MLRIAARLAGWPATLLASVIALGAITSQARAGSSGAPGAAGAPDAGLAFRRFTATDGLSSSFINALYQDDRGYLWIGTADGLNRFDGHEWRVFRFHPEDRGGIAGSFVSGISGGPEGQLLVVLGIGGVDVYEALSERFVHLSFEAGGRVSRSTPVAITAVDGRERTWFGTAEGLFLREAPRDTVATRVASDPLGRSGPCGELVTALAATSDGSLWIGTQDGGLTRRGEDGYELISRCSVTALAVDGAGALWVGTASGELFATDGADFQSSAARAIAAPVVQIVPDPEGGVWITRSDGWLERAMVSSAARRRVAQHPRIAQFTSPLAPSGDGAFFVGAPGGLLECRTGADAGSASGEVWLHRFDPDDPSSLGANDVRALLLDRRSGLWVGTRAGGVSYHEEGRARFWRAPWPPEQLSDPSRASVQAILEDRRGVTWIGTPGGLVRRDSAGNECVLSLPGPWPNGPRLGVLSLHEDRAGRLWAGTGNGIVEIDPAAGADGGVPLDGGILRSRLARTDSIARVAAIAAITSDPERGLWLASNQGLIWFDPDSDEQRVYRANAEDPGALPSGNCSSVLVDGRGDVWVGTLVGGLSRVDRLTGAVESFVHDPTRAGSLNNLSVVSLCETGDGVLWVGTYSGGLSRFDRETKMFQPWTERDGLPGDKINAILEDEAGALWLTTNRGLARFDPTSGRCLSFDVTDGLPANEFLPNAAARTARGDLLVGSVAGYSAFTPSRIRAESAAAPMVLTSFRLFDRATPLGEVLDDRGRIALSHREDFVAFEFAALDFGAASRQRYAYRLEGLDPDWIDSGQRRYAAYTDLDPGQYVFHARATNRDGSWNDVGLSVPLVVRPPFWQTAWFGLLACATFGVGAWGWHRRAVRATVRRSREEDGIRSAERARVRAEVARDYHDEMGVLLARISLYAELVRRDLDGSASPETRVFMGKIAAGAQALTRRTREFLWVLDPRRDRVGDLLAQLDEAGRALFEDTSTKFLVEAADTATSDTRLGPEAKRHLVLLFQEAMHNAHKHASASSVVLSAHRVDGSVVIELRDDGRGIEASIGRGASGQGLDNLRSRAAEARGEVRVVGTPGAGTTVRFEGRVEQLSPEWGSARGGAPSATVER